MRFTVEAEHPIKRMRVSQKLCIKTLAQDALLKEDEVVMG